MSVDVKGAILAIIAARQHMAAATDKFRGMQETSRRIAETTDDPASNQSWEDVKEALIFGEGYQAELSAMNEAVQQFFAALDESVCLDLGKNICLKKDGFYQRYGNIGDLSPLTWSLIENQNLPGWADAIIAALAGLLP